MGFFLQSLRVLFHTDCTELSMLLHGENCPICGGNDKFQNWHLELSAGVNICLTQEFCSMRIRIACCFAQRNVRWHRSTFIIVFGNVEVHEKFAERCQKYAWLHLLLKQNSILAHRYRSNRFGIFPNKRHVLCTESIRDVIENEHMIAFKRRTSANTTTLLLQPKTR